MDASIVDVQPGPGYSIASGAITLTGAEINLSFKNIIRPVIVSEIEIQTDNPFSFVSANIITSEETFEGKLQVNSKVNLQKQHQNISLACTGA